MKILIALLVSCSGSLSFLSAQTCGLVTIDDAGPEKLSQLKNMDGLVWWVELDHTLLVYGDHRCLEEMALSLPTQIIERVINPEALAFVSLPLPAGAFRVLASGGRFAVVEQLEEGPRQSRWESLSHAHHGVMLPFQPNTVLACRLSNRTAPSLRPKRAEIQSLLANINATRWYFDVFDLQCKNRNTLSDQVQEARDLLLNWFGEIGLEPFTQEFTVGGKPAQNVIAILEGSERPEDFYIVGAHYDSIARDSSTLAPGAEDNASGVAAVLEMARAFVANPPKASIIFICYSGEEQGLFGSETHAQRLQQDGLLGQVQGALIMDMIGYTAGNYDVLLETSGQWGDLTDVFASAAANYTSLNVVTSFNPFGSDHVPYLDRGAPALLVIENDWNSYPGYHRSSDIIDRLGTQMGGEVLKMNLAALAEMIDPSP